MTWLHAHLLINHFPIVGFILAEVVIIASLMVSRIESFMVGAWLMVLSGTLSILSYVSGEEAGEFLEGSGMPQLTLAALQQHEQAAAMALFCSIFGIAAAAAALLVLQRQPLRPLHKIGWTVAGINLLVVGAVAYTGYRGAHIVHTELSGAPFAIPEVESTPLGQEDELEDDTAEQL